MNNIIYFDNAATTYPKPQVVYDQMDIFYRTNGFSAGRGQYKPASISQELINETRSLLTELLNCTTDRKVVFTHSATEALNIILQGIDWKEGQNVYISNFEHNSVLRVLHILKQKYNLNVFDIFLDNKSLCYDVEKIKYQFQDNKPDVIIMTHVSNVCGLITPIDDISKVAEKYDPLIVVDGSQSSGLLDINLNKNINYFVFAGHKTLYGPLGVAGFITDSSTILKPLLYGGTGIDSSNPDLPNTIPEKFEVGSMNIHAISGLNAALKWIAKVGIDNIYISEMSMKRLLLDCLAQYSNIKTIQSKSFENQTGIISCIFDNYSSDNIGEVFNQHNIAVRTGLHCAPNAHKYLGTFPIGTVRFSLGYFTTELDIQRLNEVLKYIYDNS